LFLTISIDSDYGLGLINNNSQDPTPDSIEVIIQRSVEGDDDNFGGIGWPFNLTFWL
jgi:hypothetical protein